MNDEARTSEGAGRNRVAGRRTPTAIRLLLLTNERVAGDHPGFRDAFTRLQENGEIESFEAVAPLALALEHGDNGARRVLIDQATAATPNVVLAMMPNAHGDSATSVRTLVSALGNPVVLFWEGDAWGRLSKPLNASMRAWLAASDVVFSVAGEPQSTLLRRAGARDVRSIPSTYCHVLFGRAASEVPDSPLQSRYDAIVVGTSTARLGGRVARMPGAAGRARLVRRLQREPGLRLAVYGSGWTGSGARGPIPYARQPDVIREARLSANWDHYPRYERYFSNRLPVQLLAGRPHVATWHEGLDWLAGPEDGVFLERSVSAVVERVRELVLMPDAELSTLGARAHRWVRDRLSHLQAARYMLGAVDERLLEGLPEAPWLTYAAEWPR